MSEEVRHIKIGGKGGRALVLIPIVFASAIVTIIVTIGIWPGEAKLTAPLLCPDDRTDAFVVADTHVDDDGGTVTDYTLYCMGPRGEVTDVGFVKAFGILTVFHGAVIVLVFTIVALLSPKRRRLRREAREARQPPRTIHGEETPDGIPEGADPPGPIIS